MNIYQKKSFYSSKKGKDFETGINQKYLAERGLTPETYAKKINQAQGRWFTTNKDIAKNFSKGDSGRVVEAEISKEDLELGKN